ncbi:MFS general substrate transporter [Polychaeton citri CBS 116435]|uniref:MFS general substrate transporter n=1 Tax=Polychaeton citri CBS 116435 TaxID=1314669 RepID=A0A9P4Q5N3_9PEZI|nr:MFS general substrate transporter [Polychaeton citri CBS 116435]
MGLSNRVGQASTSITFRSTPSTANDPIEKNDVDALHTETVSDSKPQSKWKLNKAGDGDVAMGLFSSPDEIHEPIDAAEEKRLVRKIDLMILPYLAVCYAFFYIDKTTLSYAAIFGIRDDLNLSGSQYSWLSSMFYFGFLVWALPTNLLMQRLPVGRYLGANIFGWGFFLMLQAAAKDFAGLAVLRAFAGAAEACSDPGFMLVTSMFYSRRQQPVRMGLWYTANGFGIALGGLLGFGIGHIKGSLPSWKYEFLIIGALCCIWGIVMYIFLPDSPVTAKGLTTREKRIALERLKDNQTGVENKHFKWYQAREAFLDVKLYLFFLLGMVCNVPNGGISNFGTIIIKGFGFSTLVTTLMQVPYGFIIVVSILTCIFLNDYAARHGRQTRCWFIILFLCPNIAGAFGLRFLGESDRAGRLISYYLTGPYNAAFVMVLSLTTANTAGHTKKVITNAVLFLGYCVGNLIGPFFYLGSQAPRYELGIWSMIVSHLIEVCVILVLRFILAAENKRRDRIQSQMEGGLGGRDLEATAFSDMTDRENLNFRYIY